MMPRQLLLLRNIIQNILLTFNTIADKVKIINLFNVITKYTEFSVSFSRKKRKKKRVIMFIKTNIFYHLFGKPVALNLVKKKSEIIRQPDK